MGTAVLPLEECTLSVSIIGNEQVTNDPLDKENSKK